MRKSGLSRRVDWRKIAFLQVYRGRIIIGLAFSSFYFFFCKKKTGRAIFSRRLCHVEYNIFLIIYIFASVNGRERSTPLLLGCLETFFITIMYVGRNTYEIRTLFFCNFSEILHASRTVKSHVQ